MFLQHLIDALSLGSLYALLALGIALIFGIMGLINFAHGDLLMVMGYLLLAFTAFAPVFAIGLSMVLVIMLALGMERVAFRPVRGASPSTMLITSLAVSSLIQGIALVVVGARSKSVGVLPSLNSNVDIVGVTIGKLSIVIVAVTLVLVALLAAFLKQTSLGIQMRAAAENFNMARSLGVPANRVVAVAFALSGLLAAVAGTLLVARTGTLTPGMGLTPVLVGFVATVIGGLGRLWPAVLGGYVLGVLTVALQVYLPDGLIAYRDAFVFLSVIAILILRPQGIAGRPVSVRV